MVKISSFLRSQKDAENKRKKLYHFEKNILMVFGKSHSAKNPEKSSLLAKRFVLRRGAYDKNKSEIVAWKKRRF